LLVRHGAPRRTIHEDFTDLLYHVAAQEAMAAFARHHDRDALGCRMDVRAGTCSGSEIGDQLIDRAGMLPKVALPEKVLTGCLAGRSASGCTAVAGSPGEVKVVMMSLAFVASLLPTA
jgi:hypothetical protein